MLKPRSVLVKSTLMEPLNLCSSSLLLSSFHFILFPCLPLPSLILPSYCFHFLLFPFSFLSFPSHIFSYLPIFLIFLFYSFHLFLFPSFPSLPFPFLYFPSFLLFIFTFPHFPHSRLDRRECQSFTITVMNSGVQYAKTFSREGLVMRPIVRAKLCGRLAHFAIISSFQVLAKLLRLP